MSELTLLDPLYHVLLIGIDAYPPGYNSLSGCVNDIDAIEQLLLDTPGVGLPPDRIRITRLAAPRPNVTSSSRLTAQTLPPTKENVVAALRSLAGSAVQPNDRILIYYSGHGDQTVIKGSTTWREAIVPHDGTSIQYLYDVELNPLINAIAARAADVTVLLDSCHSGGATKDIITGKPQGAVRLLQAPPGQRAESAAVDSMLAPGTAFDAPAGMLRSVDPAYLAVAACQPEETAAEGPYDGGQPHGNLTHGLLQVLRSLDGAQRAQLRWADIWAALLDVMNTSVSALRQRPQHPAWIGRSERRVFGGAWQPLDVGYPLAQGPDGTYTIKAGTLLGVTTGAQLAVYGPAGPPPDCFLFSELGNIGSDKELAARRGLLQVTRAERATCVAAPLDGPLALVAGMRTRLINPGTSERLRVALATMDTLLARELERSAFLQVAPPSIPDAEVTVMALPTGGWQITNDLQEQIALVPAGETFALRAGLESYARYATVLRLARNCHDPQLANCLTLRLLDCSDPAALAAADPADPKLPEAARDDDKIYSLPDGAGFCITLASTFTDRARPLHAFVFDCGAAGEVEYLGDATLRAGDRQVLWLKAQQGTPFIAGPDFPGGATDRLIAIATTRPDLDLQWLAVRERVQDVVDQAIGTRQVLVNAPGPAAPAELWTAVVVPLRIGLAKPN
jgi:hypothetical protein